MKIKEILILTGFIISALSPLRLSAQKEYTCTRYYDHQRHMFIYTKVDQTAQFPKGDGALSKFFMENFKIDTAKFSPSAIIYSFVVTTKGDIINGKIYKKQVKNYDDVDKEALRVLSIMPKWVPAKCNNKPVSALTRVAIRF